MVRQHLHLVAALGKYRDAIAWVGEMNDACRKAGLPEATVWAPIAGDFNTLVLEYQYADLATYDSQTNKFQSDHQIMAVFRKGNEWGSASHWPKEELLVSASSIA